MLFPALIFVTCSVLQQRSFWRQYSIVFLCVTQTFRLQHNHISSRDESICHKPPVLWFQRITTHSANHLIINHVNYLIMCINYLAEWINFKFVPPCATQKLKKKCIRAILKTIKPTLSLTILNFFHR